MERARASRSGVGAAAVG